MTRTISGAYSSGVYLSLPGDNPVLVTGSLGNSGSFGNGLYAEAPTVWTITNQGTINATGVASGGVRLASDATLDNQSGAIVSGGANGVKSFGATTITNAGHIYGTTHAGAYLTQGGSISIASGGTIGGGVDGVDIRNSPGTVTNSGLLMAVSGSGAGLKLNSGGLLTNAGGGQVIGGGFGVIGGATGTIAVVNDSTITGTTIAGIALYAAGTVTNHAGALISGPTGIVVSNALGVVLNSGTITTTAASASAIQLGYGGYVSIGTSGLVTADNVGIGVNISGQPGTVVNTGSISATQGTGIFLHKAGAVSNMAGGTISAYFGVYMFPGTAPESLYNQGLIDAHSRGAVFITAASVTNASGGTISGGDRGVFFQIGDGTLVNAGLISSANRAVDFSPGSTNLLVMQPGGSFVGTVDGGNSSHAAMATIEFAAGQGSLGGVGTQVIHFGHLVFDPGASWTISGSAGVLANEAITGFGGSNAIDVPGIGVAHSVAVAGGTVSLFASNDASGSPIFSFNNLYGAAGGVLNPAALSLIDDGAGGTLVACFAEGTRIATATGETAVERLQAGDLVRSAFGGVVPVQWIGHRRVDCRRHRDPAAVWPVRFLAGAFGPGLPARDLLLSPDHAVFVDGVLIPARLLVNGDNVVREIVDVVTYYHVELPVHDVVLADGLPAESYLDTGNRASFANGGPAVALQPDFAQRVWEAEACAAQVTHGPILDAVLARLAASAARPRVSAVQATG